MARVKRGVTSRARHNRVLKSTKGHYGARSRLIKTARQSFEKAQQYTYISRRLKKRSFRALWIQRINAAVRAHGLTYGRFISGLGLAGVAVDRKMLADIAVKEPQAFIALVERARGALS
jgi:large subunit ribosomal protein L20